MEDRISVTCKETVKQVLDDLDNQIGQAYYKIVNILPFRTDKVTPLLREASIKIRDAKELLAVMPSFNE